MDGQALAKRRRGAHAGSVGPGRSPVGLRMQPPNEEFFTLFSEAGSNIVERVAIPPGGTLRVRDRTER